MTNPKTWVVMNDIQIPSHDTQVVKLVVDFVKCLKPHGIILNGDIVDLYGFSSYEKNPLSDSSLKSERVPAQHLMDDLAKVTKERVWIGGNHEDRLRRYVWKHAEKLGEDVQFDSLFKLPEHGFQWRPYGGKVMLGKLLVTHGSLLSAKSAYTARRHLEKYGNSILIGHTHRLGVTYQTDFRGTHAGWENGCLCRFDPEYDHMPDWQHGFSVVHVFSDGRFNVQQIPILSRKTLFYGNEIRSVA